MLALVAGPHGLLQQALREQAARFWQQRRARQVEHHLDVVVAASVAVLVLLLLLLLRLKVVIVLLLPGVQLLVPHPRVVLLFHAHGRRLPTRADPPVVPIVVLLGLEPRCCSW